MGTTLTKTDLDKLTYVVLEVELNRASNEKIIGAFIGFKPLVTEHTQIASKDELFLWLYKGDQIHIISLDHYKITDFRLGMGLGTSRTICTKFWSPVAVIEEVAAIRDALISRGWADETGLIDSGKFTYLPVALREEVEGKLYATAAGGVQHNRSSGQAYDSGHTGYPAYKKKEVSTTTIKRTSRYDAAEAIEAMHEKIELIRGGKYEVPKLKSIPADKKEEEKEEKKDEKKLTNGSDAETGAGNADYESDKFPWAGMD